MPTDPSVLALDAAAEAETKWLTEILLGRPECDNFRKLEGLRRNMRAAGITLHLRSPPATTPELTVQWADFMYGVLQTMDEGLEHPYGFPRSTASFLEIGSSAGGFTRYILEHTNAGGVGVSLPVTSGGIGWAIPPSNRFELHELDLPDLVSRYLLSGTLPFIRTRFDLITLDVNPSRPRLLLAQLLLALHTISDGGQILLTLSCIERPLTARILIAFRQIADQLTTSKPPHIPWSGLFYLHAQTIRVNTPAYYKLTDNLTRLWNRIQSTHTEHPTWDEQDLITPWPEVLKKSSVDLIVKLGNPLWGIQVTALDRAFHSTD